MPTEDSQIDIKAALEDFQKEFREKLKMLRDEKLIGRDEFTDAIDRLEKIDEKHAGFQERLRQIELRANRADRLGGGLGNGDEVKTIGRALVESEGYKEFQGSSMKKMASVAKAPISLKALTTGTGQGGDMIDPVRRAGLVEGRTRGLRLIDLLTVIPSMNGSIEYIEEKAWHELQALLTAQAASTQKDLVVDNVNGYYEGQIIKIAPGTAAEEEKEIDTISSATKTITVTTNLANTHAIGVKVTSDTFVFTAEAAIIPMAGMETEFKSATAKRIGHAIAITKQLANDAPALERYVNARLPVGVELNVERQLLSGDGSSQQIQGMLTHTGIQTIKWSEGQTGDTEYDTVRRGMTLATLAFYPVEAVTLNPIEWERMETAKGVDGHYLLMHAGDGSEERAWRVPVVATPVISQGTGLLGAFSMAVTVWDVDDLDVAIYDQHEDYAARGMLFVVAEKRIAFTIERPISLVKITFDNAPA